MDAVKSKLAVFGMSDAFAKSYAGDQYHEHNCHREEHHAVEKQRGSLDRFCFPVPLSREFHQSNGFCEANLAT
jgi:hypothetical protein